MNENSSNSELNENQIEYEIFILVENSKHKIETFYEEMIDFVESINSKYIWNNEKFFLPNQPVRLDTPTPTPNTDSLVSYYKCKGCIDYGDNLEDEWFVVYLLFNLTQKYKNLLARVKDFDGDFLLIHSANYLPDWASSAADNCMNNRVFIYNGQLHIIPPATNPSQITYLPAHGSIESSFNGAKIVYDFPKLTIASEDIQQCLAKKLSIFDSNSSFHRATCIIPAKLVWLIKNNPSLISSAINRFCDKDPSDLKLCHTLNTFKPTDFVNYRVQFTKHLYGKLKYCDYKPERRHNWPSVSTLADLLSPSTVEANDSSNIALIRERSSMGFKLTCAFEIISRLKDAKASDKPFDAYLKRLRNMGYFKDYLENSKKYNELMNKARESFRLNESVHLNPVDSQAKSSMNNREMLDSFCLDDIIEKDYVIKLKEEIIAAQEKEKDDSDDWLCVEAPQLDDYLEMYSRGDVSSTYDFRIISNAFRKFLQPPKAKQDLLEGAEYKGFECNSEEKLIDLNMDSVEQNLKDLLNLNSKTGPNEKKKANLDGDFDENDDENDSFYEIDDDLLEDDEFKNENKQESKQAESSANTNTIKNYIDLMDEELKGEKDLSRKENSDDLDLDINLVSNALESYSSQLGITGPVSNILKSLGL